MGGIVVRGRPGVLPLNGGSAPTVCISLLHEVSTVLSFSGRPLLTLISFLPLVQCRLPSTGMTESFRRCALMWSTTDLRESGQGTFDGAAVDRVVGRVGLSIPGSLM